MGSIIVAIATICLVLFIEIGSGHTKKSRGPIHYAQRTSDQAMDHSAMEK